MQAAAAPAAAAAAAAARMQLHSRDQLQKPENPATAAQPDLANEQHFDHERQEAVDGLKGLDKRDLRGGRERCVKKAAGVIMNITAAVCSTAGAQQQTQLQCKTNNAM